MPIPWSITAQRDDQRKDERGHRMEVTKKLEHMSSKNI